MITVKKTDDLNMAITEYIRNVDRAVLNTVFENTVRRVNKCLETGGGHFKHYCNFLYCNYQVHRDFLSPFLATDTEVSGSIPGATRFSEW